MRRSGLITLVAASVVVLVAGAGRARAADVRREAAAVVLLAGLTCAQGGGADVTFTVRNLGHQTLTIENDFHLFLDKVDPPAAGNP